MVCTRSTLVIACLLVLMIAAPSVHGEAEVYDASDLVHKVLQRLGYESTTYAQVELAIIDEPGIQRFASEVWWLPDGLRRVELTAPSSVAGAVILVQTGRAHVVRDAQSQGHGMDLASLATLFTIADDLLAPFVVDVAHWREAEVTMAEHGGRTVYELRRTQEGVTSARLLVDAASYLPLSVHIDEGAESIDLLTLHRLSTDANGEVIQLELRLAAPDLDAELQLNRLGDLMVPTRVKADVLDVRLEMVAADVHEAVIPDELRVTVDMLPFMDERYVEATELTTAGRYLEAAGILEALTREDPYHVDGHIQLGYVYMELGDMFSARASFEQALVLDPSNLLAANNLAYILIDTGIDVSRGVQIAREVTSRQPRIAAFLDTYGWGLYQLGAYEDAVSILAQAVDYAAAQISPRDQAIVLHHFARALLAVGRTAEAWDVTQEGNLLDPQNADLIDLMHELTPL